MTRIAMLTFNDVPATAGTDKYAFLGRLAMTQHAAYCRRHGYSFLGGVPIDRRRPACWAKLPGLIEALKHFDWAMWADSDTLVADMGRRLESFVEDDDIDLVVQHQDHWWARIGLADGNERFPINSGVFLIRASPWSIGFLAASYAQTQYVDEGALWNRIGDQEAMNHVIRADRQHRAHIRYVKGLQTSPLLYERSDFMVHFYGNHLRHRIPACDCTEIRARWQQAVLDGLPLPPDLKRFHWCCLQNRTPEATPVQGDLATLHYRHEDLAPTRGRKAKPPGTEHGERPRSHGIRPRRNTGSCTVDGVPGGDKPQAASNTPFHGPFVPPSSRSCR